MLQQIPPPLLGTVLRLAARDLPGSHAKLNLACRATHEALPHAFASELQEGSNGPLDLNAWCNDADDPHHHAAQGGRYSPVLHFNLDHLGSLAYSPPVDPALLSAEASRTGQRFAQVCSVRLIASQPLGVMGAVLFADHVAPRLLGLRRLYVLGPATTSLPPFWLRPAFARVGAALHTLSMSGHYSTLVPFAAQLSTPFPSLTALHLTIFTYSLARRQHSGRPRLRRLSVDCSPGMRVLSVAVHSTYLTGDNEHKSDNDVLTLDVAGRPSSLSRLIVDSNTLVSGSWTGDCRPVLIAGRLPSLTELDITLDSCFGPDDSHGVMAALPEVCPSLKHLLLRSEAYIVGGPWGLGRVGPWTAIMRALAPLASSLVEIEVRFWFHRALMEQLQSTRYRAAVLAALRTVGLSG